MPVSVLRATFTEREFTQWVSYFRYKDPDETEVQLATLAYIVSIGLGNKEAKLDDYLINKQQPSSCELAPPRDDTAVEVINGVEHEVMSKEQVTSVFASFAVPMES